AGTPDSLVVHGSVSAQEQRARGHHVAARREGELRSWHLVARCAADLTDGLDDQVDAVHVCLRQAAAARVVGQVAAYLEAAVLDEAPRLARLAEAVFLAWAEAERREALVALRHDGLRRPASRRPRETARP